MRKRFFFIFALAFCLVTFSETKAQFLLKRGKIPQDLVIAYEHNAKFSHYKLTIKSDGSVQYEPISVLPAPTINFEILGTKINKKKPKNSKIGNKLSKLLLKELVAEFEKVDFFNFPNSFLTSEDGCNNIWISDKAQESIFLQISGKKKEVSYNSGCGQTPGSKLERFRNLINKINESLRDVFLTTSK